MLYPVKTMKKPSVLLSILFIIQEVHPGKGISEPLNYCLDCSIVDCIPELHPSECPQGYFYKEKVLFGCCPGCVKYLDIGETCKFSSKEELLSQTTELECTDSQTRALRKEFIRAKGYKDKLIAGFHLLECRPDSSCNSKGLCELNEKEPPCSKQRSEYLEWIKNEDCTIYKWEPRCNEFGFYGHVQSKSNIYEKAKKFCSDPQGLPISGTFKYRDENELSSCLCSRKKNEIMKIAGKMDSSLHCTSDGSYEKLQCEDEICWCMDPLAPYSSSLTSVVPDSLMHLLPCYKKYEVGESYLRRCESRSITKTKVESLLQKHGHFWSEYHPTKCEYDGSFWKYRCTTEVDRLCKCLDPFGNPIIPYSADISPMKIDCNCARDKYLGLSYLSCANHFGGYQELQILKSEEFCVDKEGFQWSMSVMKEPIEGTSKRCQIDGCAESIVNCANDNCVECPGCGECNRDPGESCYP